MESSLIVSASLLLTIPFLLYIVFLYKSKNLPPGPSVFTLLINYKEISNRPYKAFQKWVKIYGSIYRINAGTQQQVIISDYKLVKALFNNSASTGRLIDNPIISAFGHGGHGVANAEGDIWQEQRRFTLQTLRDFGFGRMEHLILDEAEALLNYFDKHTGEPIPATRTFNAAVVNALWRIVTGQRCEWENGKTEIQISGDNFFESQTKITSNGLLFCPMLRHLAPEYFGWNKFLKDINRLMEHINNAIKEHEKTFDENNLRDFIDCFLLEKNKATDPNSGFYQHTGWANLSADVFDFFTGGSETTANTLAWAVRYLTAYPDCQEEVYKEIQDVLGTRLPSLSDRVSMPHTEAFLLELFRIAPVLPLGIPHRMLKDYWFQGYCLPKGISVFPNIYAISHDVGLWKDPNNFRPSRFFNSDGKLVRHEALMNFGAGKRKCIGENLAKDTLFLFLVTILQTYKIVLEDEDSVDLEPGTGFMLIPKDFNFVLLRRSQHE